MSRAPLPEVRGSRIAGLIERERALLLLRKQRARHVQLSFGEALIVTREGEGEQTEKGDEEMASKKNVNAVTTHTIVVHISQLVPCPLQPIGRTGDPTIKALAEKLRAQGGIKVAPVVVPAPRGKYMIADGHRRTAAARLNGFTEITVAVDDSGRPVEVVWAELNRTNVRITGAHWFATWALCRGDRDEWLKHIPPTVAMNIRLIVKLIGLEDAVSQGLKEWSDPQWAHWASELYGILSTKARKKCPSMNAIYRWIVAKGTTARSGQVRNWKLTMRNDAHSAEKFCTAILRSNDFPPEKWVTRNG